MAICKCFDRYFSYYFHIVCVFYVYELGRLLCVCVMLDVVCFIPCHVIYCHVSSDSSRLIYWLYHSLADGETVWHDNVRLLACRKEAQKDLPGGGGHPLVSSPKRFAGVPPKTQSPGESPHPHRRAPISASRQTRDLCSACCCHGDSKLVHPLVVQTAPGHVWKLCEVKNRTSWIVCTPEGSLIHYIGRGYVQPTRKTYIPALLNYF